MEQCQFIDLEAEVSEDEYFSSDTESEEEHELETSFVADDTEVFDNTQVHCHYLQSIKLVPTFDLLLSYRFIL